MPQYDFGDDRIKVQSYDEVIGLLEMIYAQGKESGIKNVVIDSVSALEPLIWDKVCVEAEGGAKDSIEDFGYGGGYKRALKVWQEFMSYISALRTELKVNVWLIGHSQVKSVNDPENEPYDRYIPALHAGAMDFLQRDCDAVLFAKNKVAIRKVDKGMNQKKAQGFSLGEPILITRERPSCLAKNRSQPALKEEMPFDVNAVLSSWNQE